MLRLSVQRQGGIESGAEDLGHGQLLSLGLGGGGQFQVALGDLKSLSEEDLGSVNIALRREQQRQVVQVGGGVGVTLAQRRLVDRQGLLVEGLGGGVVPLASSSDARLFRLVAVSGWCSPRAAFLIARACS